MKRTAPAIVIPPRLASVAVIVLLLGAFGPALAQPGGNGYIATLYQFGGDMIIMTAKFDAALVLCDQPALTKPTAVTPGPWQLRWDDPDRVGRDCVYDPHDEPGKLLGFTLTPGVPYVVRLRQFALGAPDSDLSEPSNFVAVPKRVTTPTNVRVSIP